MMEITDIKKDYIEKTITVHYEGEYDPITLTDEIVKEYSNDLTSLIQGNIVEHSLPNDRKGFHNSGVLTIKL